MMSFEELESAHLAQDSPLHVPASLKAARSARDFPLQIPALKAPYSVDHDATEQVEGHAEHQAESAADFQAVWSHSASSDLFL